jgi:alanyl aminopeptidase
VAAPPPPAADRILEPAEPALRLPRNFLPVRYAATLAIDPARDGFDGRIAITGTVSERSLVIWLHGHHLTIRRATAHRDAAGGTDVELTATPHGDELLELRAATPLDAGSWTLALDYTGAYDALSTTGAFKQTVHGEPYVYSQLEAVYARRVFPCFDEPDSKVPWQLTLEVPAALVAVSNTPVARETPLDAGRKRVEFAPTRPLPSYLVAFGVGPFDVVDAGATAHGTPIRVIALHGRAPDAAWAAKTAPRLLELLEELFGSPYPYAKLDLLAIPLAVGFGAMENAGLVTFSEPLILLPPHAPKLREYDWVRAAAHELGHQWFGDLVTMAWWNDIWLNEGFANWVEHKISARFEPAWHEELAEIEARNSALGDDSLVVARKIRQPIATPDDIFNVFDGITYDKGASVLGMFERYVGPEVFLAGVRAYLVDHAYGNATSDELVRAIGTAAGKDIRTAFATFLDQPGAPQITATLVCDPGKQPRVALGQERYVPPGAEAPEAGQPWIVPVCVAYDRGGARGEACTLLDAPVGSLALDEPACPAWVMPNAWGRGYYRTAYTEDQVTALRDQAWPVLAPAEREAVMFDVEDEAALGALPLPLALSFVPRLLAAGDRFSIRAALAIPLAIGEFVPDDLRPAYEAWLRRTFGPAAHQAGLTPSDRESLDLEVTRDDLVHAVGTVGRDPVLAAAAVVLAGKWRDLPPAIRPRVAELAAPAQPAVFQRLLRAVYTEDDRQRRLELIGALAATRDVAQQRAVLALVLDPKLDIRDTSMILGLGALEPNRVAAQQFFRDHQAELLARLPQDGAASGPADLSAMFTASCAAARRDEIAGYITATFGKLRGGARVVAQQVESLDQCIARRALLEPAIRHWLAAPAAPAPAARGK